LAIVLTGYSLINWTGVFALAIFTAYLFSAPETTRRNLFLFLGVAGAAATIVLAVSVLSKMQSGTAKDTTLRWSQLYNAYLFGPGGYMGYAMTWPRAILRLVAANVVGLLPLLSLGCWIICRAHARMPTIDARVLTPLLAAALSIAVMRNYFAHHAWMAASLLIFGMIFSVCLVLVDHNAGKDERGPRIQSSHEYLAPTFVAASFLYCCVVVLLLRANSAGEDSLRSLIQQNTRRHEIIVVSKQRDVLLAENVSRLSELVDRYIVVRDDLQPPASDDIGENCFRLSASPLSNGQPELARTPHCDSFVSDLARKTLAYYRRIIARRAKGDQLETAPTYYLFSCATKQPGSLHTAANAW
jgi:hypothetical protein